MAVLLTLLDANNKLVKHAARELNHAMKAGHFFARPDYLIHEQRFFQSYFALREVEIRGLRLLHEMTLLGQLLRREEAARQQEEQLEKNFRAQEQGNGKKAVILSPKDLKKQEQAVIKDRKLVQESIRRIVEYFLAQHEILVRTDRLFHDLNAKVALLHPRTDRVILKAYGRAGDSKARLLKQVREEVEAAQPLELAHALFDCRGVLRHHLTALSDARREFAGLLQKHLPMMGTL